MVRRSLPIVLMIQLTAPAWVGSAWAENPKDDGEAKSVAAPSSQAVEDPEPLPELPEYGVIESGRDFFEDQRMIWTKPFSLKREDTKWLVPLGLSTLALKPLDREISDGFRSSGFRKPSKAVSALGGPAAFAAAGAFYGIGKLTHKDRVAETGLLGMRAVGNAYLVVAAFKEATNRQRPYQGDGDGSFWEGGRSFPSGHAAETWALATVLAHRYPDKRWVQIASYGVAAGVSASRLTGRNHHASDVLIGSAIGFLIGRYIVKNHQRRIPRLD